MMKIAVLSDIHGNLPALQTVTADIDAWQPDLVVVNGDVVNRGPCSLACAHFVQERQQTHAWQVLSGNHESFVLACGASDALPTSPAYQVAQFAHWTYVQLNGVLDWVAALPNVFRWQAPDDTEFRVKHASMRSNREGLHADDEVETLLAKMAPAPTVYVTAHTHQTFVRQLPSTLVVNIGAVGAPFDEDRRAGYGRFTWDTTQGWQADIIRLPYDLAAIERDYVRSGFLAEAGPLAQLMLVELRKARGLMFRWGERHYEQVMAGEISIEDSVWDILRDEDVRPFTGPPGWLVE